MKKAIYLITLIAFFFCIAESCSKKDPAKPALPKADFTIKSDANGKVTFTNTSTNASKFLWNFGNNEIASARDTTVQYIKNATYKVSLLATSTNGESDTKEMDVVVSNIEIPKHMSFEGIKSAEKVSIIDGQDNVSFKNEYESCCGVYKTEVYKSSYRIVYFLISQSETGYTSTKNYQDIVKNIFVKGYNKMGILTTGYSTTGLLFSSIYNNKPISKLEVIEVVKEDNKSCVCDPESFWIKYKVENDDLKGSLTIKYDNPCCLK